jgi:hypothetical protein
MRLRILLICICCAPFRQAWSVAPADPWGAAAPARILVNDKKINDDIGTTEQRIPAIAMHRNGPAVCVWQDDRNGHRDIYFQLYGRRGNPFGALGNVKVNENLIQGPFYYCDAAMDGRGHFVVAFDGGPLHSSHVYGQWYYANGKPLGGNQRVDDGSGTATGDESSVAASDSGTSVIAWKDDRNDARGDIYFQLFDRDGAKLGGNVLAAGIPDSAQKVPAAGMTGRGDFILAWQDGYFHPRIMTRLFASDGTPKGEEIEVAPLSDPSNPACFMPCLAVSSDGGFAVAWMADYGAEGIQLQACFFDSTGHSTTGAVRADEEGKFNELEMFSVASYPAGGRYVFAWAGRESGDWNIYSHACDGTGHWTTASFVVNDRPGDQMDPHVAMDDAGDALYVWADNRNGNVDVYANRIGPKSPAQVTAGSGFDGMVPVTWEPWYGQDVRTKYKIYRTQNLEEAPVLLATVDPSLRLLPDQMLDFIDNTAVNGVSYYYAVETDVGGSGGPRVAGPVTAKADGHVISSALTETEPVVDGVLFPGEWDEAAVFDISEPSGSGNVRLFLKNSDRTLYLAVDDLYDEVVEAATLLSMLIDLNHNGSWPAAGPSKEGLLAISPAGAAFGGYWGTYPDHLGGDALKAAPGVGRAISNSSGHVQYEVALNFDTSPLAASPGQTLGFAIWIKDPGNFYGTHYGNAGEWPAGALWEAAETLGSLKLAVAPIMFIVTNTQDSGPGSFRLAIEDANLSMHPARVVFQIPITDPGYNAASGTWTLRPGHSIPELRNRETLIDGTSQAAFIGTDTNPLGPEIVLDGSGVPSASGLYIYGSRSEVRHLVVSGFDDNQIDILSDSCAVAGCFIGTDASGLRNTLRGNGIHVWGRGNIIGGSEPSDRNVISGLKSCAVDIMGYSDNRVLGNYIGINAAGEDTLGNAWGVRITDSGRRNTVGPGNVISGNRSYGIWISQNSDSNSVIGNRVGTDRGGGKALGNDEGIRISGGCSRNTIGGASEAERNLISGNVYDGISLNGSGADSNSVFGNYIGTDADGSAAVPNGEKGISIRDGACDNRIGGVNSGEGNLISGNNRSGVHLFQPGTCGNRIMGNIIGLDTGGMLPLGNGWSGIELNDEARNNRIGPGNHIAYNTDDGIAVGGTATFGNRITQNRIHDNGGKGILLGGGNKDMQAPVLTAASPVAGTASPGAEVEIFTGPDDEGMDYLATVTADGSGNFTWSGAPTGKYVTATATDAEGNTSGFSNELETGLSVEPGWSVPARFSLSQNHPNPFNPETTIRFDVKDPCRVVLKVYDIGGREVAVLTDGRYGAGRHAIRFDASCLPSGIYVYRIQMGKFAASRKMVKVE